MSDSLFTLADAPLREVQPGLRHRQLARSGDIALDEWFWDADHGSRSDTHSHGHAEATYVVSGLFEVQFTGQDVQEIRAGDTFLSPPDVQHRIFCLEAGSYVVAKIPVSAHDHGAGDHQH